MSNISIQSIIEQMRETLKDNNSELANFPQYGNLYSIYRSVALLIKEQNEKLNSINNDFYLSTTSGINLDNKASDYNLSRFEGSQATGSIIVKGSINNVDQGVILTSTDSQIQFEIQENIEIINNRGLGVIRSLVNNPEANLQAGSILYNSLYPNIEFIVGHTEDLVTGEYVGSLLGGQEQEDDESFRGRIYDFINSINSPFKRIFRQSLFNIPEISKLDILENEPGLGYVTIYINSSNQQVIDKSTYILEDIKPLGISVIVKSFKTIPIYIDLVISVYNQQDTINLEDRVRTRLDNYVDNLSSDTELTPESIASVIYNLNGVVNVKVLNPSTPIYINKGEQIIISNININYK